jgi:hypothetical protein
MAATDISKQILTMLDMGDVQHVQHVQHLLAINSDPTFLIIPLNQT